MRHHPIQQPACFQPQQKPRQNWQLTAVVIFVGLVAIGMTLIGGTATIWWLMSDQPEELVDGLLPNDSQNSQTEPATYSESSASSGSPFSEYPSSPPSEENSFLAQQERESLANMKGYRNLKYYPAYTAFLKTVFAGLCDHRHEGWMAFGFPLSEANWDYYLHMGQIRGTDEATNDEGMEMWSLSCWAEDSPTTFDSSASASRLKPYSPQVADELAASIFPYVPELESALQTAHKQAFSNLEAEIPRGTNSDGRFIYSESTFIATQVPNLAGTIHVQAQAKTSLETQDQSTTSLTAVTYRWFYTPTGQSFVPPLY